MHNLIKQYPQTLELFQYNESQRVQSLMRIFKRDIEENSTFMFQSRPIRPTKKQEGVSDMQLLFGHLTTHEIETVEYEKVVKKRVFEINRSIRLHWIAHHVEDYNAEMLKVFSVEERNSIGKNVIRTYIFDEPEQYVIILEPYRKHPDYYLITAYYLEARNMKKMKNKMKRQLDKIH
jgi:hypothetical protein